MPLKAWIKAAPDHAIQISMKQPDLEFVWVGDDAIDPLQQAQTLVALVGAGIKTREEARAELGLGGEGKALGKYSPDQPRDDRGRWTSEGGGDSAFGVGNNEGSGADSPDQATTSGGGDEGAGVAGGSPTSVALATQPLQSSMITCDHLFELDRNICVAIGDEDKWLLGQCMRNALLRFKACVNGQEIPNLVNFRSD